MVPGAGATKRTELCLVSQEEAAAITGTPKPLQSADWWGCRESDPYRSVPENLLILLKSILFLVISFLLCNTVFTLWGEGGGLLNICCQDDGANIIVDVFILAVENT